MISVASFDVFDTVLVRRSASAHQVFLEVGDRLRAAGVITVEAQAFAAAREHALVDLTPDTSRHPSLQAVAGAVASRLGLADDLAATLMNTELEVEFENCCAVPGAVARLAAQRAAGRRVVFVSDTSWPAALLQQLLAREGLFTPPDRLYTSAQWGASKQHGGLFDLVAADLHVAPEQIRHIGDDRISDVAHARLHGWNADLDRGTEFLPRERAMLSDVPESGDVGPRLAASSRQARLTGAVSSIDPGMASIAGAVAAPLLIGYGLWILQQARLRGLDRLYFVARDGEVFLDVTQRLARRTGNPIDCRYLHGSRKSWQLAAAGTAAQLERRELWLPDNAMIEQLTARDVLSLVDLSPQTAAQRCDLQCVRPQNLDRPLGPEAGRLLVEALTGGALAASARVAARARRDLLVAYLDQHEVTATGRVGLVDVGWTGRAARALEDVLIDTDRPVPAAHLFVGLLAAAPELMGADLHSRAHGWLIDETRGRRSLTDREDPVMLIESFAMGSEGHTVGFAEDGDRVVARLAAARNPSIGRWDFAGYRTVLAAAVEAFTEGPAPELGVDLRPLVWRQLLAFWRSPTAAEATAWGAQPYGEDFANALTNPLATPLTARRMLTRLGLGRSHWRAPTYWLPGTLALSPFPWRQLAGVLHRVHHALPRMRRIPARIRLEWTVRRRS